MNFKKSALVSLFAAGLALSFSGSAFAAANAETAKATAKRNDCFKCHAIDKTKKGPSYKKIAEKWKTKADYEAKLIKHLTSSPKVKLEDGTEEDHKAIDTKDQAEIKNLISWIMEQ